MGLGRGAEQLEAFVFAHGIGGVAGNRPNDTTSAASFPPAAGRLRKNSRQEPRRDVFSNREQNTSNNGSAHQKRLAENTVGSPKAGAPTGTRADETQSDGAGVAAPVGAMDYHEADAD